MRFKAIAAFQSTLARLVLVRQLIPPAALDTRNYRSFQWPGVKNDYANRFICKFVRNWLRGETNKKSIPKKLRRPRITKLMRVDIICFYIQRKSERDVSLFDGLGNRTGHRRSSRTGQLAKQCEQLRFRDEPPGKTNKQWIGRVGTPGRLAAAAALAASLAR